MKYVRRVLALTSVAAVAAIAAVPAVAAPRTLNAARARNMANSFAMNRWDPSSVLPDYSQATSWDDVSNNDCWRWSRTRIDCVVTVEAQNYYYDPIAEEDTGYAYCVGTITVRVNRWGRVNAWAQGFEPAIDCDSTDDTSNY